MDPLLLLPPTKINIDKNDSSKRDGGGIDVDRNSFFKWEENSKQTSTKTSVRNNDNPKFNIPKCIIIQ